MVLNAAIHCTRVVRDDVIVSLRSTLVYDRRSRPTLGSPAEPCRRAAPSPSVGRSTGETKKGPLAGLGWLQLIRHKLELVRHSAELGKRTGLHLPHCSASMYFHRRLGDADIAGNLFAEAAS